MATQEFDAKLVKAEGFAGDGAYVEIPFDVKAAFGRGGLVPVKAYFDGYLYRGSLSTRVKGKYFVLARQDVRQAIGKQPGDTVHMVIELDIEPRIVEVPQDFATAMAVHPRVRETFDKMAYTHRKEYVKAIEDAKKPETRERNIYKAIEMIKTKIKD